MQRRLVQTKLPPQNDTASLTLYFAISRSPFLCHVYDDLRDGTMKLRALKCNTRMWKVVIASAKIMINTVAIVYEYGFVEGKIFLRSSHSWNNYAEPSLIIRDKYKRGIQKCEF